MKENNFWEKLLKPFFCIAPMADVTDVAYRAIITKYSRHGELCGGPDVFWTEFVSADGLCREDRGILKRDLEFGEYEKPIVAQLFSSNIENMRKISKMCTMMGFSGIDINMGCPDRSIEKQGCGSAMIKTPEKAKEIIQAVKDGINDAHIEFGMPSIPVSVKTRVGYHKDEIDTWIRFLLEQDIACLSVHARTRKEMSKVPADWSRIKRVVKLRNEMKLKTLIVGNGDVLNIEHGEKLARDTGCDGIMVGRSIFGNPWLFDKNRSFKNKNNLIKKIQNKLKQIFGIKNRYWLENKNYIPIKEKLRVLTEHAYLFEEKLGDIKNFAIMKKHFKAYANGFPRAKELREKLMATNSAHEIEMVIDEFLKNH